MENPTHSFREVNLVLQLVYELKLKLWWVGARERKKENIICNVYFVRRKFVLSQCIVYWINFQNVYILLHIKKHYFIHFCCLFLKSSKAISVAVRFLRLFFLVISQLLQVNKHFRVEFQIMIFSLKVTVNVLYKGW